jgi:hypothetical protein
LKITDLTSVENFFVIFEDKLVDEDGYLMLDDHQQKTFPWLTDPDQILKRTLKIEVTFFGQLILMRFIHLDKLYPKEYPKLALQIVNNQLQNSYLKKNQQKVAADPSLESMMVSHCGFYSINPIENELTQILRAV